MGNVGPEVFFWNRLNGIGVDGNKEVALKLGARYGSAGWYAPPGVDLAAFGERGWL